MDACQTRTRKKRANSNPTLKKGESKTSYWHMPDSNFKKETVIRLVIDTCQTRARLSNSPATVSRKMHLMSTALSSMTPMDLPMV